MMIMTKSTLLKMILLLSTMTQTFGKLSKINQLHSYVEEFVLFNIVN